MNPTPIDYQIEAGTSDQYDHIRLRAIADPEGFVIPKGTELRCIGKPGEDCEALIGTVMDDVGRKADGSWDFNEATFQLADGTFPKEVPPVCPECGCTDQRSRYPDEPPQLSEALRARALKARRAGLQ